MKKILLLLSLSTAPLCAAPLSPVSPGLMESEQELVINNRILLKIKGKPLTVMDVVRKMDLIFYRQFPELASSAVARYQFFSSAWESILAAVIDDQLIYADAQEKKVEVSEGDVREELEQLFGPDVVLNLDKVGMTLEEAMEMLKTDLTVQRMNMMMVRSKAMTEVHPKQVRQRYDQLLKENPPQDRWVYRVLSVRGENHEAIAQEAHRILNEQNLPFEDVVAALADDEVEITLSQDYEREDGELSLAHKAILQTLSAGGVSDPVTQGAVSRIFCLKEFHSGAPIPFNDMANEIKAQLIQEIAAKHDEAYRLKLRDQYGLSANYLKKLIPEGFQPFTLR